MNGHGAALFAVGRRWNIAIIRRNPPPARPAAARQKSGSGADTGALKRKTGP